MTQSDVQGLVCDPRDTGNTEVFHRGPCTSPVHSGPGGPETFPKQYWTNEQSVRLVYHSGSSIVDTRMKNPSSFPSRLNLFDFKGFLRWPNFLRGNMGLQINYGFLTLTNVHR